MRRLLAALVLVLAGCHYPGPAVITDGPNVAVIDEDVAHYIINGDTIVFQRWTGRDYRTVRVERYDRKTQTWQVLKTAQ